MRAYLNDLGPASDQPLLGKYNSQEAIFQCTTCGACEFQCPVGIEHVPIITGLRRGAVNTGAWEDNHGSKLFLALGARQQRAGNAPPNATSSLTSRHCPSSTGPRSTVSGWAAWAATTPRAAKLWPTSRSVMNYLGTSYGVLRKEKCTGDPVRRLGNDLVFQQLAEANLEALAQNKVKKIVSICPHCVRTIQEDWKEYGTPPEIEHHSEFLARYTTRLPTCQASGEKIVYHDPCYLGRYRNVYDEPRAVAALAGQLVEAPRNHERSFCCGAGGGLAFLGEETGERVSHNVPRNSWPPARKPSRTACPFCNTMFRDAWPPPASRAATARHCAVDGALAERGLPVSFSGCATSG